MSAGLLEPTITAEGIDNKDRLAHYADKAKITEAHVLGTAIIALCGFRWVPSRHTKDFEVCGDCREIYETLPA